MTGRKSVMSVMVLAIAVTLLMNPFNASAIDGETDYSGEWTFNESKSNLGEGRFRGASPTLTVKQDGINLVIERVRRNREGQESKSTEKLTLDGKECKNDTGRGTRTSTASWSEDGKTLTINSVMVFDRGGETMEMKSAEVWELTDGGKSLTIKSTSSTPGGERKTTLVYDKK